MRTEYRLLDRAVRYALAAAGHATPPLLAAATPCPEWDLGQLLAHLGDSCDALAEGLSAGRVQPFPGAGHGSCGAEGPAGAPSAPDTGRAVIGGGVGGGGVGGVGGGETIADLAGRAAALLWACAEVRGHEPVAVGDRQLSTGMVATTGAIEVAVHGWDISVACGANEPVPSRLATELLPYAALLVPRENRPGLFGEPVRVARRSSASDRLVAFLGRPPSRIRVGSSARTGG